MSGIFSAAIGYAQAAHTNGDGLAAPLTPLCHSIPSHLLPLCFLVHLDLFLCEKHLCSPKQVVCGAQPVIVKHLGVCVVLFVRFVGGFGTADRCR